MEQAKAPVSLMRLELGSRYFVAFSRRRLLATGAMIVLLAGCAWALWQGETLEKNNKGWLVFAANVGSPLIGVSMGLILAPTPRPVDYDDIAAIAVDEMAELSRSTDALASSLDALISSDELAGLPVVQLRLALMQEELGRQSYAQVREIARWSRVAPGSEDEIVKGRQTSAAILRKLEREQDYEPDN